MNQEAPGKQPELVARLLTNITDFVEPITRFDRSHLPVQDSAVFDVAVTTTQFFDVLFPVIQIPGTGSLPGNVVRLPDASALRGRIAKILHDSQVAVPLRLHQWIDESGKQIIARLTPRDCFDEQSAAGYQYTCETCSGHGELRCHRCGGQQQITCTTCLGSGQQNCGGCSGSGSTMCNSCSGRGTYDHPMQRSVWDSASNSQRMEDYFERRACHSCSGSGHVRCTRCSGSGQNRCFTCFGNGRISCPTCHGQGVVSCSACAATGQKHQLASVSCEVHERLTSLSNSKDEEIRAIIVGRQRVEDLLIISSEVGVSATSYASGVQREFGIRVPVTSVTLNAGQQAVRILGFGNTAHVFNFQNLAGSLLASDLKALEIEVNAAPVMIPALGLGLGEALSRALASEVHLRVAESAAGPKSGLISLAAGELRLAVSEEYVLGAATILKRSVSKIYRASLLRASIWLVFVPPFAAAIARHYFSLDANLPIILLTSSILTVLSGVAVHTMALRRLLASFSPVTGASLLSLVTKMHLRRKWLIATVCVALLLPPLSVFAADKLQFYSRSLAGK